MMMHVCGDRLVELNCVSGDNMDEKEDDFVCKVDDLFRVG
jgi:hypothetical protein